MDGGDFYMVLPSNVPTMSDEQNKTSNYRMHLPKPLELNKHEWEVALVQINYPHSWCNVSGETALIEYRTWKWRQFLNYDQYFVNIKQKYYKKIDHLITQINNKRPSHINSYFEKNSNDKVQLVLSPAESIILHPTLSEMLGFRQYIFENQTPNASSIPFVGNNDEYNEDNKLSFVAALKTDLRASLYNIFIYCNIVESTLVGNTYVPLLQAIAVDDIPGTYITKEFENPHYLKLQTGFIPNIEIRLCDDIGENMKFEWGKVIVKLHFRQITT